MCLSLKRSLRTRSRRCGTFAQAPFTRNTPESWHGEFQDCCKTQSIEGRRGRVKFRECVRNQRWLYELIAGNSDILPAVADLIGDPVAPHVRGLYPVFPTPVFPVEGHCDRHKFQVGVVLYLSNVLRQGGGFTVWPGSHHVMAKHHGTLGGKRLSTNIQPSRRTGGSVNPTGRSDRSARERLCSGISGSFIPLASTRDRPFVTPLYAISKTHATSPLQIVRRRIYGEHGHLA